MRFFENIFLLVFIFVMALALAANIYVVNIFKSKKSVAVKLFNLDSIYFDLNQIEDKDKANEINTFITDNPTLFANVLKNDKSITGKFYAFCGLLRFSPGSTVKYLEELLNNSTKININISETTRYSNYDLGFAVLMLLKLSPEKLTKKPDTGYFSQVRDILVKAYKAKSAKRPYEYNSVLISLIEKTSPDFISTLYKTTDKPISEMNEKEKLEVSNILSFIPKTEKPKTIKVLLNESNEEILFNALNSIDGSEGLDILDHVFNIYLNKSNKDLKAIAQEKYILLNITSQSSNRLYTFLQDKQANVIIDTLNKIGDIGGINFYEFLKLYLKETDPEKVNLAALAAIIKTIGKSAPEDLQRTINYILRNLVKNKNSVAIMAIRYNMDNGILANSGSILYRFRMEESLKSVEMKNLAIDYIDKFNLASGISFLQDLSLDSSSEIRARADSLLQGKFKNMSDNDSTIINNTSSRGSDF